MDNEKKMIEDFVDTIPQKLDPTKNISLFELMIKKCPNTIEKINLKLLGKSSRKEIYKDRKWYTAIINYLVKKEILWTEKKEGQTYHTASDSYTSFFINPQSTTFSLSNAEQHIKLYEQTAKKFLYKAGLTDKEGNEILKKDPEQKKKMDKKKQQIINVLCNTGILSCLLYGVFLVVKYDLKIFIPILSVCLLLMFFIIVKIDISEKK